MKIAATTLLVSCLLAACGAQLLPCAPDCSEHHTSTLFPNPHDCSKYFQCASSVAIPRQCHDGLHFNPVIEVCDYPDSAGCTADPDFDCNAGTTTAEPVVTTTLAATTTAEPVDTTTLAATTTAEPADTTTAAETTTGEPVSTTAEPVSTTAEQLSTTAEAVVTTTVAATTTAEPVSTTAEPVVTTTAAATTTAEPVSTTAEPVSTTAEPVSTTTLAATTTAEPVDTTTAAETTTAEPVASTTLSPGSTTESGECRPECPSDEALFPNPRDCASFFQCAFGFPFLHQCPAGQWYDAPNERCDYQGNVECNAGPDTPCVAITNPTEEPPATTTGGSGTSTTDGGDDCVPPCPSDEALYPNPRDCGSFFQCAFGVPYLLQCPEGQEYAAALERCDYPEIAQCTAGPDSPCVAVTIPPQF